MDSSQASRGRSCACHLPSASRSGLDWRARVHHSDRWIVVVTAWRSGRRPLLRVLLALVVLCSASHGLAQPDSDARVRSAIEDLSAPRDYERQRRAAEQLAKLGPAAEPALPALINVISQPLEPVGGDVMSPVPGFEEAIAAARRAVLKIGPAAVPALIEALGASKGGHHVVELLGELNDPRSIRPLVEAIGGSSGWSVQETLIKSKLPGVSDAVAAKLNDPNPAAHKGAVLTLIGRRDQRALPAVVEILAKGTDYERWEAVGYLANLRPPDARERLHLLLNDKDRVVASEAASRLGDVGDQRDVPALMEALKDPYHRVRWGAIRGLGLLRDARAIAPLEATLKTETEEGNRQAIRESIRKIRSG